MANLLDLVHKSAEALRRRFRCRRLGVELEVRLLAAHEVAAARAEASTLWGDRELRHAVDEQALSLLVIRAQTARAVFHEGAAVGAAVVAELDETTLRHWAAEYSTLEDLVDPPLETWTDAEVEDFVDGLKKRAGLRGQIEDFRWTHADRLAALHGRPARELRDLDLLAGLVREHLIGEEQQHPPAPTRRRIDGWNEAFDPNFEPELDHEAELARLWASKVRRRMASGPGREF